MKKNKLLLFAVCSFLVMGGCNNNVNDTQNQPSSQVESGETEGRDSEGDKQTDTDPTESATDTQTTEPSESQEDVALKDLCSDFFSLGVGINGSTLENQTLNMEEYMALSKKHFNSCTMTNLMKSSYILDQAGSQESLENGDGSPALSFASIDPTLQWCKDNGMKMRGHTLVWHAQAPDWFFRDGYDSTGDYVDKETMLFRMESYIEQMLTHVQTNYPGVVYCWDVVNEAVDPDNGDKDSAFLCRMQSDEGENPWYKTIGEDYVEMAFTYARKYADEDVKLFYNDFNTYQLPKREAIYALCSSLKEKGLIDGIGMQGYWGTDYPSITSIEGAITLYAKLDLEIHITELSVGVDEETEESFEKQAKRYGSIFIMLHNLDNAGGGPANITNVTFFGLIDHYRTGDTTNSRLFDKDYQPKPAYDKIKEIMQKCYVQKS